MLTYSTNETWNSTMLTHQTNQTWNSTNSATIVLNQTIRISLLCIYPTLLVLSLTGLLLFYKYLRQENGPSTPFIKAVIWISSIGVVLGIPMEWYSIYIDFQFSSIQRCMAIRLSMYLSHFSSSLINISVVGAMVLHRYMKFRKQDVAGFKNDTTRYLMAAISLGVLGLCPISWDLWFYLQQPAGDCSANYLKPIKCDSLTDPCSTFITVVTVSAIITVSCTVISNTSLRLTRLIRTADERANTILQMKRSTNTSRIKATQYLMLAFCLEWIPYGVSRFFIFSKPTLSEFLTVTTCCHALSTVIFLSIPIIFYKMDGRFAKLINELVKKTLCLDNKNNTRNSVNKEQEL